MTPSRSMAGEFYRGRWRIEVEYRGLKQTLGRSKVPAHTPERGPLELAANIVAMALLLSYAALAMGMTVTQLSLSRALRAIRKAMEALRYNASCATLLHALRIAVRDEYERRSSKRARDRPHKKKERPPSPPKLRKLLVTGKNRIHGLWMTYQAQLT